MAIRRGKRKPRGGFRGRRRRMMRMRPKRALRATVPEWASCSETIIFTGILPTGPSTGTFNTGLKGTTFPAYRNTDLSLSTFNRAQIVGACYQQFRIKYLELSIVPDFDTFIVGGAGAQGKPFFYYILDKGNSINFNTTNQAIKSMGAKPIALDEKTIKIRWRPGVVLANEIATASGTVSAQQYMTSPWLPTDAATTISTYNPSQVCHQGIKFFAENVAGSMTYSATLTAHFEFKKPSLPSVPLDALADITSHHPSDE